LHHFEEDYHNAGGRVHMKGMGKHRAHSDHPLATRKITSQRIDRIEFRLSKRQMELRDFAEQFDYTFYPMTIRSLLKFKGFPIEKGKSILYEENILSRYTDFGKIEISDVTTSEGGGTAEENTIVTVVMISDLSFEIPNFALEPEKLWTKLFEHTFGKDVDFIDHPDFSGKYYLRADDEESVHRFFSESLINYLEAQPDIHIESQRGKFLFYQKLDRLATDEIQSILMFCESFINQLSKLQSQKPVL
jgi:hypothetical protein